MSRAIVCPVALGVCPRMPATVNIVSGSLPDLAANGLGLGRSGC
jgi:hypothetical protein